MFRNFLRISDDKWVTKRWYERNAFGKAAEDFKICHSNCV